MSKYDDVRERHYNGMCGGDCPECLEQQRREAERDDAERAAYEDAAREYEERVV